MNIYTSYFAQLKNFPSNFVTVSICGWPPKWYNGLRYKKVAPSWSILEEYKNNPDIEKYTNRFNKEILSKISPQDFINDIKKITNNAENVILLCYEKPSDFCHRHLVAEWINNNTDIKIKELEYPISGR